LQYGADPHIEDYGGQDACDYAKKMNVAYDYVVFQNCDPKLKKRPHIDEFHQDITKDEFVDKNIEKYEQVYRDLRERTPSVQRDSTDTLFVNKNKLGKLKVNKSNNNNYDFSMQIDEPNQNKELV